MGVFLVYILKSSVCLAVFYLFYRLLLSRETFHRFNRVALLSILLLSICVPFIILKTTEPVVMQQHFMDLELLLAMATVSPEEAAASVPPGIKLLLFLYYTGVLFFLVRMFISFGQMIRIIRQGEMIEKQGDKRLIVTNQPIAPFSWMKYIVISRKDAEDGLEAILNHEKAHIRFRHSWDILFTECCVILHWFNPAVWLLKQELQNIHEYEADEQVLKEGIDAKNYQLLLIKKAVGSQLLNSMANSFNHSKLKKRITMMLKRKSSPWARVKYLYVLPLTALAVTAFARPEISQELEKISSVKVKELLPIQEAPVEKTVKIAVPDTTVPVKTTGKLEEVRVVGYGRMPGKAITPAQKDSIDAIVARNQKQLQEDLKAANLDELVTPELKIAQKGTMESSVALRDLGELKGKIQFIVDGVMKEDVSLQEISPDMIERIEVVKDKEAVKQRGGDTSKEGLIVITTKKGQVQSLQPLYIVDGEEVKSLEKIDLKNIESVTVLKDESAAQIYGEKGKNGVILVTMKKGAGNSESN